MSFANETFKIAPRMNTGNDAVTVILNTTINGGETTGDSGSTIGSARGVYMNCRLVGRIKVGNQAVTWSAKKLSDGAWIADPDAPIADGSTLTASTSYDISYHLRGEVNVYTTNGSTGPDDLDFDGYITSNPEPGAAY